MGVYVHVPFCERLCPYCDFAVAVRAEPDHEGYADALCAEWEARRGALDGRTVRTIYFGGGTPSLWAVGALRRFVGQLGDLVEQAVEVTLEANPVDVTLGALDGWSEIGIDRLSIGIQSFDDAYLRRLGRNHDSGQAREAVQTAVADGRFRTTIDLIYGGPGYDDEILEGDLRMVRKLGPNHVSAYQLTVEPNTVFGRRAARGELGVSDDDRLADFGAAVVGGLAEIGYERYEVSSFGRGGDRGLHNAGYWSGAEYLGLGVGAHSLRIDQVAQRRANPRRLSEYLDQPGSPANIEDLTAPAHLAERLFLAARARAGARWDDLREQFASIDAATWERVEQTASALAESGLLVADPEWLKPTPRGIDFADEIGARFFENCG